MMLKPGDAAPDFEVKDDKGRTVGLSEYKGQKVLTYWEGRFAAGDDGQGLPPAVGLSLQHDRLVRFHDVMTWTQPDVGRSVDAGHDSARLTGLRLVADEEHVAGKRHGRPGRIGQDASYVQHDERLTGDCSGCGTREDGEDEHAAHAPDPTRRHASFDIAEATI